MKLRVLSVAYPLAAVGRGAVGGAEQVLTELDEALVEAGHESLVIAQEGSSCRGRLIAIPRMPAPLDEKAVVLARAEARAALRAVLEREEVDVVHFHGLDFPAYLPETETPLLATLHLPPGWYALEAFRGRRGLHLHCVSATQRRACPPGAPLLDDIPNGVRLALFPFTAKKGEHAVALGRICPEKGFHLALQAAKAAGVPLRLAGQVFEYPAHRAYFDRELAPLFDADRRFVGPVGLAQKPDFLGSARCLLVPSLAPETSSLVAMEALACGTPVIAFPSGALAEIVEHGRTGFLVKDAREMAEAIARVGELDPAACREAAERQFSSEQMVRRYFATYARLARRRSAPPATPRASCVEGLNSLEALERPWSGLFDRCADATPFQSPEWLLPHLRVFGAGGLRTHLLWRGKQLVGLLPLREFNWEGEHRLGLAGAGISDCLDALVAPSVRDEDVARWLAEVLGPRGFDRCRFEQLPLNSRLLVLRDLHGFQATVEPGDPSPVLALPASVEAFHRALPASLLRDLRYCERRGDREHGVRYHAATAATLAPLLDGLFDLHGARWEARGETGVLANESVRAFHRQVAAGFLRRGWLRLYGVTLGEALAGMFYGFARGRTTWFYLGGFDPRWARFSPGKLALAHAIERAIAEGCDTFDFLRGREPYKYTWGAVDRPALRLDVWRAADTARAHSGSGGWT